MHLQPAFLTTSWFLVVSKMQNYFFDLSQKIRDGLKSQETFTCFYQGEDSSFVRLNHGKVRQPGQARQHYFTIDLAQGKRHAKAVITLSGLREEDDRRVQNALKNLRDALPHTPEDPYFLVSEEVCSSENIKQNELPSSEDMLDQIMDAAKSQELVGIFASGPIFAGFANERGQQNWYASNSFNFDWSFHHNADRAVKSSYAGLNWENDLFEQKMDLAKRDLDIVARPTKKIVPGKYDVFLAPAALGEIVGLLNWGGFSERGHQKKESPLMRLGERKACFHKSVQLAENVRGGVGPSFGPNGFIKPDRVSLIQEGNMSATLVSPRTSKEFGIAHNGAEDHEHAWCLDMEAGALDASEVAKEIGQGLYINNLWYLNYSDRPACRMTGMTRFGCFWIENGEVQAPINVMRFDDSPYRMLGENLRGLTKTCDFMLSSSTYFGRSTSSQTLPGAMVSDMAFTL